MGVPPWELLERPEFWVEWALTAETIDAEAARILRDK